MRARSSSRAHSAEFCHDLTDLGLNWDVGISPDQACIQGSRDASSDALADAPSTSPGDGGVDVDGASCTILESNYDQSCAADTDCVGVSFGNYCLTNQCFCGGGAINSRSVAQFNADVAKTPVGSGAIRGVACPCPAVFGPCCRSGICTGSCWSPSDTLGACADAGGSCAPPGSSCSGGSGPGPSNSCAYPDETCCLQ